MSEAVQERIKSMVESHDVVLFMKGTRRFPQCGFSASTVEVLDEYLPEYETVNVLADPDVREGVKVFSDWPTIPQLYVKGEFVGGADIVREMHESGELEQLLGMKAAGVDAPSIRITDSAMAAFLDARQGEDNQTLRLEVSARFQYALSFGPKHPGDVEVTVGALTLLMNRGTARRANGMSIDFVTGPTGSGFKIENPNEPPSVKQIAAPELKHKMDAGEIKHVYDVRSADERDRGFIEGSVHLDADSAAHLEGLDRDTPIAFYCAGGFRSQAAADSFLQKGFKRVYNLAGGLTSWAAHVDPSVLG